MRATRERWRGRAALGLWVVLLVAVGIGSLDEHGRVERPSPETVDERFVAAWERGLEATFFAKGTFERRSDVTGSSIKSEDVVVQDPPRRLHRQLGAIDGRVDDRLLVCPATPEDGVGACTLGEPGGNTYAEDVAAQVASLRQLLALADPVYVLSDDGPGCFTLSQRRSSISTPFGNQARYCFDANTGALVEVTISYAGGVHEHVEVDELRAPRDQDFVP